MKNSLEIRKMYEERKDIIRDLRKKQEVERNHYKVNDLYAEMQKQEKYLRVLENNFRNVFFEENIGKIVEILNKYVGKKAGEKTRQKVKDEIFEAIGVKFYFENRFFEANSCDSFTLQPLTEKGFSYNELSMEVNMVYNKDKDNYIIDKNNIFQNLEIENFKLSYTWNYIDNLDGFIFNQEKEQQKIKYMQEVLNDLINNYNEKYGNIVNYTYYSNLAEHKVK